ncbi:hypothetical protein [Promicromonospora sp. NPDC057488]|uniref:hypothetical protein n=1 Tax=Promicromonospora sp. NPDC057488 TaxID=3346147 RepID=UPI003671F5AB
MATINPEVLLSGWRGRRFLLEYAAASDLPLAGAVMSAGYELDPVRDTTVVSFFGAGSREPEPRATPEAVASLLAGLRLTALDQVTALSTLAQAVSVARYWQEPDGEDLLAATPAVRAALERVAAHVAGSETVGWWSTPLVREDQHAVTWDGRTPATTATVAERLTWWRAEVLDEERRAQTDRPSDPTAPFSGTWWSAPPSDLTHTSRGLGPHGPAGLRLVEDDMGWERAVTHRVEVPAGARVLEVDGPEAWAALCREYPLEVTAQKRHDWYSTTGRVGRWVLPDWAAVAAQHDAVHLTAAAYLAAAGTAIPVDDDAASVIAGWSPDETYWFVDTVRPQGAGTEWVLDDEDWVAAAV